MTSITNSMSSGPKADLVSGVQPPLTRQTPKPGDIHITDSFRPTGELCTPTTNPDPALHPKGSRRSDESLLSLGSTNDKLLQPPDHQAAHKIAQLCTFVTRSESITSA